MPRLRRAWECKVKKISHDTAIFYAETAAKARYQCYLSASDSYQELTLMDITVHRAAYRDVALPDPHWLLDHLTKEQKHIVLHSFGGNHLRAGYRDHFYARPDRDLTALVYEFGLMSVGREYCDGTYFLLTDIGRDVAASMVSTYPRC